MVIQSLSEYQRKILDTLSVFDKICRDNGLKYSIAYGSMIGAVRHGSMIPWDDDVDVLMPRDDFLKLVEVMKNYDDSIYYLEKPSDKDYFFDFIFHFVNKTERMMTKEDGIMHTSKELNMYFDIFVFDETIKGIKYRVQAFELEILYSLARSYREIDFPVKYGGKFKPLISIATYICKYIGKAIPLKKIIETYNNVSVKYNGIGNSYFVSNAPINIMKMLYDNNLFDDLDDIKMSNHRVLMSARYDEMLKKVYGDYMTLPPESDRKTSHYQFEKKE